PSRPRRAWGTAMIDEAALSNIAREAVEAEKLPNRTPSRIWGGTGFWTQCAICGTLVNADELGYELQFLEDGDFSAPTEYHVHVRCYTAWDQERRRPVDR
ncbi:MAG TPA: hypothetical protein VFO36_05085, partial [Nitrospiraceae bacterium]|nr:hypothetical protein [Nitrospiraceae bacterium]